MLNIDSIENGIVIDHIKAGFGMKIYEILELDKLDCGIAIIKNAKSNKYGKKDIIKIEGVRNINLDALGFVDSNVTVCYIVDGKIVKKEKITLPNTLTNVIRCKNPRCITTAENGIDQVFYLCENNKYRCKYCDQEYTDN
jgi:aspartate carbamoyltransferase regulatory subunit